MKHAFIIQVHAYPEQLKEIVSLLASQNHYFIINIDKKVPDVKFKEALNGFGNVIFTEGRRRISVNHAGFSQIECTINLLRMAQELNVDYVHSLSGQDFPCVDNDTFDAFFEKCGNKSYMHYDSPEEARLWSKNKYPDRYMRYYAYDMPGRNHLLIKALAVVVNDLLKYTSAFLHRNPISNVAAGWSWFTWHKNVVNYVLTYIDNNPLFLKRFKYTACCDEVIFHTLLNGKDAELNIEKYNSLRFVEWHPKRPTQSLPLVLNEQEYDDIVQSGAFFCRKIHPEVSAKLKEMLKRNICL